VLRITKQKAKQIRLASMQAKIWYPPAQATKPSATSINLHARGSDPFHGNGKLYKTRFGIS